MKLSLGNRRIGAAFDRTCAAPCRNGTFVGRAENGVTAFRGIPFALPPVGHLRWKPPLPPPADPGVYEAFHNGPSPIQTPLASERASLCPQSEDCLYLNVWTASGFAGKRRAVLVFIHGGSYGWGGTADPLYDGHRFVLAHPEIVLVTIAYRIGLLGFMDFSEVPGGEAYAESGNLGLLDQVCALRWIHENIPAFGGDPENVTVSGESAGGGSVTLLPLISSARGLFSRVISQSGSVVLTFSRKDCLPLTRRLLKETGAKSMAELSALPEEKLVAVNKKLNQHNNYPERDGLVIPLDPYAAYEKGEALPVQMIIGTNADELRYWILDLGSLLKYRLMSHVLLSDTLRRLRPEDRWRVKTFLARQKGRPLLDRPWKITELMNELLFRLPAVRLARAHAAHGNSVYMYFWQYPSSLPRLKACHAVELAYLFNNLHETIYTGEGLCEPLARQAQRLWVAFAQTGNPSLPEVPWAPFTAEAPNTLLLDREIRQTDRLKEDECRLLYPLLDYYLHGIS